MRRYAIRFLVAVLTFGIGIALSLALGFFKPGQIASNQTWFGRRGCSEDFRARRAPVLNVYAPGYQPLKLVQLRSMGSADNPNAYYVQILLRNQSDKTISHLSISSGKVWGMNGKHELPLSSNVPLQSGDSRLVSIAREIDSGLQLQVDSVIFEDGTMWTNPADSK
jgi:hypothetical protein